MDDVVRPPSAEYCGARLRQAVIKKFDWTDERTEKLRTLFATGFSATYIARELDPAGELTRNAIIGKLHRLKLFRGTKKHAKHVRAPDHQSGSRAGVVPKPSRPKPPRPKHNHGPVSPERALQLETVQLRDLAPETSPYAVSLLAVTDEQCRWPLNEPGPDFLFCGDKAELDCSYCARHAQRAFTTWKPYGYAKYHLKKRAPARLTLVTGGPADEVVGRL